MKVLKVLLSCLLLVPVVAMAAPKIALIGDSTVCDYAASSPKRGWGQMLPTLLTKDVVVINEAKGGASTKTFPAANWQRILDARPDFVFIQFGHNDSHAKDRPESTDAATDYRENLRRYISETRAIGAEPILVTPMHRRTFRSNGDLTTELKPYADAMKAVGAEEGVKVIDLYQLSGDLYTRLGEEGSDAYTVNKLDDADRPGKGDRTHFSEKGATEMAILVVKEFPTANPSLAAVVKPRP